MSTAELCHLFWRVLPLWNTVTAQGPAVSVARRLVTPLFCLTVKEKVAVSVPPLTEGINQLWLGATDHPQAEPVVTVTSPRPPAAAKLNAVGVTR